MPVRAESTRMSFIDKYNYAFNYVMALKVEAAANREKDTATIHVFSMELEATRREISTLTKVVKELREIVFDITGQHQDVKAFIDDEAEEVDDEAIDDDEEKESEVIFIGHTVNSSKKRRII